MWTWKWWVTQYIVLTRSTPLRMSVTVTSWEKPNWKWGHQFVWETHSPTARPLSQWKTTLNNSTHCLAAQQCIAPQKLGSDIWHMTTLLQHRRHLGCFPESRFSEKSEFVNPEMRETHVPEVTVVLALWANPGHWIFSFISFTDMFTIY